MNRFGHAILCLVLSSVGAPAFAQVIKTESPGSTLFSAPYTVADQAVIRKGLENFGEHALTISLATIPQALSDKIAESIHQLRNDLRTSTNAPPIIGNDAREIVEQHLEGFQYDIEDVLGRVDQRTLGLWSDSRMFRDLDVPERDQSSRTLKQQVLAELNTDLKSAMKQNSFTSIGEAERSIPKGHVLAVPEVLAKTRSKEVKTLIIHRSPQLRVLEYESRLARVRSKVPVRLACRAF